VNKLLLFEIKCEKPKDVLTMTEDNTLNAVDADIMNMRICWYLTATIIGAPPII